MKNTSLVLHPTSNDLQNAMSKLEKHMTLAKNNNELFKTGIGADLTGCFLNMSMKRTQLFQSRIHDADFTDTALTGSYFSEVNFQNVLFDKSNLEHCHLIYSRFTHTKIKSTNLSYSNFYSTDFTDVEFIGSTVAQLLFENCHFKSCRFQASMMENAIFSHCTFEEVEFAYTNVEYMELKQCILSRVSMPFIQIPYVFGAYCHLNDGEIIIVGDDGVVGSAQYYELLQSLLVYYSSVSEFFPITNIYISLKQLDRAYESIMYGLQQAAGSRNFRLLKFFCKLAVCGTLFRYEQLRDLYSWIENCVKQQKMNVFEERDFIHNISEIRYLLLDQVYGLPTAQIIFQTNIDSSQSEKIINFVEYIDQTIHSLCAQGITHIEYRHHSDAQFIAFVSAHYVEILFLIQLFFSFAMNATSGVQKRILDHQQIELNKLKIKRESLELQKLQTAKDKGKELENAGIKYDLKFYINNVEIDESRDINFFV